MSIPKRQTTMSGHLVLFCRFLRKRGYTIGPVEQTDAVRALELLPFFSEDQFRQALKIVLAKSKRQQVLFNDYYDMFWQEVKRAGDSKLIDKPEKQKIRTRSQPDKPTFDSLKSWLYGKPTNEEKHIAAYSDLESLTKKDFSNLSEEEMKLMMYLLRKLARRLAHRKSRLTKRSHRKQRLDLKRTIRQNFRQGTEIRDFVFSRPKNKRLRLVVFADASKSMELYSRFFIHLIYAFQNAYDHIETFAFSTALFRLTDILNDYEFETAFDIISERIPQWAGGTKIGFSLNTFCEQYAHRLLHKNTTVFILSDGWDTGAPEVLQKAMKTIHSRSKRVIWLNPLSGNPDYSPEVTGLQTAMPFIDVFAPAHNLESLQKALKMV